MRPWVTDMDLSGVAHTGKYFTFEDVGTKAHLVVLGEYEISRA